MKKILKIAALLLPLCMAMSCEELLEMLQTDPTVFQVTLTSDSINASQTEVSAKVVCDVKWTAKLQDPSWGKISETVSSGENLGVVVIGLGFNQGKEKRSNVLVVTAGSKTVSVSIDQEGTDALIKPGQLQLRGVEPATLNFMPGTAWTMTSDADWIALPERKSGLAGIEASLSIKAKEEFVDVGTREGKVTFTFDDTYKVDVPVTQYQTDAIILEQESLNLDYKAQTITLRVDSNVGYTVLPGAEWVHRLPASATKALNVSEETFVIDANPTSLARTAAVTFAGGEQGKTFTKLTIVQEGRDPILDITTCGLYGVSGTNYEVKPNLMQASRTLNGDGTYTYRILLYKDLTVCTLSGLPVVQEDESKCTLRLTVSNLSSNLFDRSAECILVGQDDNLRWYRVVNGQEYFIVPGCIQ